MTKIATCRLKAKLHLLPTAAGGRQTAIKKDVYRPQFYLGSSSASCRLDAMEPEAMSPGDAGEVELTLVHPERFGMDLRSGSKFEIREGARVVGWGIIEDVRN
jgi:translation elongation factor EF-Tu-like GTPase